MSARLAPFWRMRIPSICQRSPKRTSYAFVLTTELSGFGPPVNR